MAQKIFQITDQISGKEWHYTSITACLEDVENPIDITGTRWSQIVKERDYPFEHSGCNVEKITALSSTDVREQNPPVALANGARPYMVTLIR